MSVTLTPKNFLDHDQAETIQLSNGGWQRLVDFAKSKGVEVSWDGNHDPVSYSPGTLAQMADVLEDSDDAPDEEKQFIEGLRWLADNGGAELG